MKKNMDGYCIFCAGYGSIEEHHLVPRSHGGGDEPENIVHLCKPCHRRAHAGYGPRQKERRGIGPWLWGIKFTDSDEYADIKRRA